MAVSTPWRPQPPSISDPRRGDSTPWEPGEEGDDVGMDVGDARDDEPPDSDEAPQPNWIQRARDAFQFSTTYVDSNYRKSWEDSIRAFNSQHPSDSKYNTELFRKRSNLYRPKTRAVIRKNEAAAAAAYFSNLELVSVDPLNESIKESRASADVMGQLLRYRLTISIPWFLIMMGAIQDAQVQGASIAHIYWRFTERYDKRGRLLSKEDQPVIDLIPIENMRIDPSAHWLDPINTSPYLIHLIPMYWCDVKDRMNFPDPKGVRWKKYPASAAFARGNSEDDSTRQARIGPGQDPAQQKREISDYDIVWIHRHIHRWNGQDWEFYTLASERLLTKPALLSESVWHGERPYVMGRAMIETHKPIPSSLPTMTRGLQDEANDIQNQRSDNIKFVLNKAYLVKRGKNVDLASLVRNVPGRITLVDDPEKDVQEVNWQDVTQSAYLEQDRIDGDFNDIAGNFSPLQVNTARTPRESTHTMKMLAAPSNLLTEYMLKTHTETFAQPVLRQLMMLEQEYETDEVVLALAGQKAQLNQKYGMNQVTDDLLDRQLTLTVNVGMGATDPVMKLQRFVYAVMSFANIARQPPPGLDLKMVAKELFGLSGYQDGARFMIEGQDPEVVKLMQQNQELMKRLQQVGIQIKNKEGANVVKLQATRETNQTRLTGLRETNETRMNLERLRLGQQAQSERGQRAHEVGMEDMRQKQASRELLAQHIMKLDENNPIYAADAQRQGRLYETAGGMPPAPSA